MDKDDLKQMVPGDDRDEAKQWQATLVWPLASPREVILVKQVRAKLVDDFAANPAAHCHVQGDIRLLRFLRGFGHNVDAAVKACRDMLHARKEYNMDGVFSKWAQISNFDVSSKNCGYVAGVQEYIPAMKTASLHGHQICYIPIGDHDVRAYEQREGLEAAFLPFQLIELETRAILLDRLSRQRGKLMKLILIYDLSDVTLSHVNFGPWKALEKKHLNRLNLTMADHLARAYIINTPTWVRAIVAAMRPFIPPATMRKFVLLNTNWRSELEAIMAPRALHRLLGFRHRLNAARAKGVVVDESGAIGNGRATTGLDGARRTLIDANSFTGTFVIAAGSAYDCSVLIDCGMRLEWEFLLTGGSDIDFQVTAHGDADRVDDKDTVLRHKSIERIEASQIPVSGHYSIYQRITDGGTKAHGAPARSAPTIGLSNSTAATEHTSPVTSSCGKMLVFKWSNAYSWLREKTVMFKYSATPLATAGSDFA